MPILTVQLAAAPDAALARAVADDLLEATARLLGKQAPLTAVALSFVDPAHWFVGGRSLVELGLRSAFVEARVTDETNTRDQKARYIAQVYARLRERLGPLHETSYVQVQDLRATAWGYGGRTQAARALEVV